MKFDTVLETVAAAFPRMKLGGKKSDPKLAALDRGVLTVGLLLAALDGEIFPGEYATIQRLARQCRGGSAKNVRSLLDAAMREAGELLMMAQSGLYAEKVRLAAFVAAADKALPDGFADGSLADVRRAFALWVTIGVADGDFSKLEKDALEALSWRFAAVRVENGAKKGVLGSFRLFEMDFLEKAERIVRDLAKPAKREKAEAAFEALIETVRTDDGSGKAVDLPSSGFDLDSALQGWTW